MTTSDNSQEACRRQGTASGQPALSKASTPDSKSSSSPKTQPRPRSTPEGQGQALPDCKWHRIESGARQSLTPLEFPLIDAPLA